MKKAQISVSLVGIEPATPCVRGGSLERSAIRGPPRTQGVAGSIPTREIAFFTLPEPSQS